MDLGRADFEPLGRHHDRAGFTCDEPSLTDYLRKQARQDVDRDLCSCWVLCVPRESSVIGYYTLSATAVDVSSLPPALVRKAGRYPMVGAALIGRLAVDSRYAGQGVGSHLLLNALRRVLRATASGITVKGVVVDALHDRAALFYERFGFERITGPGPRTGPIRLVLSLATIREIFPGEGAPLQ